MTTVQNINRVCEFSWKSAFVSSKINRPIAKQSALPVRLIDYPLMPGRIYIQNASFRAQKRGIFAINSSPRHVTSVRGILAIHGKTGKKGTGNPVTRPLFTRIVTHENTDASGLWRRLMENRFD
ncbi:MAG: hypothetical protein HQM01_09495 [Magnetococcales bacterium]|nr:hypothetical protein [Magnetococcales bacterium]